MSARCRPRDSELTVLGVGEERRRRCGDYRRIKRLRFGAATYSYVEGIGRWICPGNATTAAVTLLAVLLGGWLSVRNQDRTWRRDHSRQWRDIRLTIYQDFLSAYREYLAFVQDPAAKISAVPHPHRSDDMMPFFDSDGRPHKERLEATRMAVNLVSEFPETIDALLYLMQRVRNLAGARSTYTPAEIPQELWDSLFTAHNDFLLATRRELGLIEVHTSSHASPPSGRNNLHTTGLS